MWIEFKLCSLHSSARECLINSDHIIGFTHFITENEEAIFKISFFDEIDEFVFSSAEVSSEVFDAFKSAINGYSTTIDNIGYVKPLSCSKYEAGTLCAPATYIDWRNMP